MKEKMQPKFETIMMIDDNSIDLYITSRLIGKNNFGNEVLSYTDAREALKYLQDNINNVDLLPDVIFVDIYMPLMSGFEFLEEYDKLPDPTKKYCKVYIISSSFDKREIARAENNKNVIAFQEKPITLDFLNSISKEEYSY